MYLLALGQSRANPKVHLLLFFSTESLRYLIYFTYYRTNTRGSTERWKMAEAS